VIPRVRSTVGSAASATTGSMALSTTALTLAANGRRGPEIAAALELDEATTRLLLASARLALRRDRERTTR